MGHGIGSHGAQEVLDPVCGMTIDPADAAGTSELGGTTYHFCSSACKRTFDADPARFGVGVDKGTACDPGHGCCH